MQRRDSLGSTTKIPRLSKGSTRKFRTRREKNLDGNQGRSAEAEPASGTLVDPFDEGERTLIRPDFEPDEVLEREEVERTEETSERSEVEPREEVLFEGMSKSETKSRQENTHIRLVPTHLWPSRATTR